jgi:hypothetical protein
MILLASPLAFKSPLPAVFDDFLTIMGKLNGGERLHLLKRFAQEWQMIAPGRLNFVVNTNDIVCSDVEWQGVDLIPIQQGFNAEEKLVLNQNCPNCIAEFTYGAANPLQVVENHAVENYLKSKPFRDIFQSLI